MCESMPGACGDTTQAPESASTGAQAINMLDEAGLSKGVILSLGYFYGVPELAGTEFDDHRLVRSENEYVADQVSLFGDRLVGFFSVNPLAEYAIDEIRNWAVRGGLVGLKLHLANSDFDFNNREHVRKLREVFELLNESGMPVIIHLRNRNPEYGYSDAALFIDSVARHAPDVTMQLAHAAGWGGYDSQTDGAIQAFLDAIDNGVLDRSKVWFDIAALMDEQDPDESNEDLRKRFREIGLDRLLFATDWEQVDAKSYMESLAANPSLSDAEWRQIFANEAPYLRD